MKLYSLNRSLKIYLRENSKVRPIVQRNDRKPVVSLMAVVVAMVLAPLTAIVAQESDDPRKRIPVTSLTVSPLQGPLPTVSDMSGAFEDFWEAAQNLYFRYAEENNVDEISARFMMALNCIWRGEFGQARERLQEIAMQADRPRLRDSAETLLTMLDEKEGKTLALFELPEERITFAKEPVALPIRTNFAGLPRLDIEINGTKATFLLDTGSDGTLIASDVAEVSRVRLYGDPVDVDNLGASLSIQVGTVDSLKLGTIEIQNARVSVVDESFLQFGAYKLAGIIGWPILSKFRLEFNYGANSLAIAKSEKRDNPQRNFFWFDYPFVRIMSPEGVPLNFGLDTGSDATRIKRNLFKKLPDLEPEDTTLRGARLGNRVNTPSQMLREVRFLVNDVQLDYQNIKTTDGLSTRFVTGDGRLGADIFQDTIVLVDFPAGDFRVFVPESELKRLHDAH